MIKKILGWIGLCSLACFSNAENLNFITVLSAPIGTFQALETADASVPVQSPRVNFCNAFAPGGTVTLTNGATPVVTHLNMAQNTKLTGLPSQYSVSSNVTVMDTGELHGKRLLAADMDLNATEATLVAGDLYSSTIEVAGAKADQLNVNSGDSKITVMGNGDPLLWSNRYQEDFGANNHGGPKPAYAAQYLLKEGKVCEGTKPADTTISCNTLLGVFPQGAEDPNGYCGRVTISYACNSLTGQWETSKLTNLFGCRKNGLSEVLRREPCDQGTGYKYGIFEVGTFCGQDGITGQSIDRMKPGTTWDTSHCDGSKRYYWKELPSTSGPFARFLLNVGYWTLDGWTYEGFVPHTDLVVLCPICALKYTPYFLSGGTMCSYEGKPSPEPTCSSSTKGQKMVEYMLNHDFVVPNNPYRNLLTGSGWSLLQICKSKTYECVEE